MVCYRFAFEPVEHVPRESGCKVVVLDGVGGTERKLADDLMAITTVFVASHDGMRSAAHRKARKEAEEAKGERGRREGGDPEGTDQEPEMDDKTDCGAEGDLPPLV